MGARMNHGDMNLKIIRQLKDGRQSFRVIAESLGVAENTVRSRVREMGEAGVIRITALVDPAKLDGHTLAIVGVKLNTMDLMDKCREFGMLTGVVAVAVVTGRFHLMLLVLLKEGFGLQEFYRDEVTKIDDVVDCETFVVYGGHNLMVPYVLEGPSPSDEEL